MQDSVRPRCAQLCHPPGHASWGCTSQCFPSSFRAPSGEAGMDRSSRQNRGAAPNLARGRRAGLPAAEAPGLPVVLKSPLPPSLLLLSSPHHVSPPPPPPPPVSARPPPLLPAPGPRLTAPPSRLYPPDLVAMVGLLSAPPTLLPAPPPPLGLHDGSGKH